MGSILWSVLAALLAVGLEVVYRRADVWPLWCAVPALLLTITIYNALHSGPSMLIVLVTFGFLSGVLRMVASHWILGEEVVRGNMVAGVALLVGAVVSRLWR